MKKIILTAISIVIFQLLVFPQTEFGLTSGLSANWSRHNLSVIQSPITPGIKLGLFVRRNFVDKAFTIAASLDYSYLISTGTYTVDFLGSYPIDPFFDAPVYACEELNNRIFNFDFHQVSVPISFQFNSKFVQPYFGTELYYKQTKLYYEDNLQTFTVIFGIGMLTGIRIQLSDQSNLNLGYTHGFTVDWNSVINDTEWYLKSSHVEATFQYTFKKRNKDKKV